MKKHKYPPERITKFLIWLVLFCVPFKVAFAEHENPFNLNTQKPEHVKKIISDSDNIYIDRIGTYSLENDKCSVIWEVTVYKDKEEKNITLSTRQRVGVPCTYPFAKQLPFHRQVLNEIFKDWDKGQFRTLLMGSLEGIEPANIWNIRIAMASADSFDWEDRCKNYPHHKSGKSSNQIFVELANQVNAYKELVSLFKEFGLTIKLDAVEKVFVGKAETMPFYHELKLQGLKGNPTLMYDAAMNYFSFSQSD